VASRPGGDQLDEVVEQWCCIVRPRTGLRVTLEAEGVPVYARDTLQ
jgi:hypothetical protein